MLSISTVREINRLLQEGQLSQRTIAARLGVSRGIVGAIASGRRSLQGKEERYQGLRAVRCRRCGYRVYPPCLICSTREYQRQELREIARHRIE
jgi:transcriptional regulator with XRE-family HTH domain